MALLYDLIMLLIIVVFCIFGAKRGILRSIVLLVTLVLSLLIGFIASELLAEPVYDSYVKESVVNSIKEPMEDIDVADFVNEKIFNSSLGIEISDSEIEEALGKSGDISENIADYAQSKGIILSSETVRAEIDSLLDEKSALVDNDDEFLPSYLVTVLKSAVANDYQMFGDVLRTLAKTDKSEAAEGLTEIALKPIILIALRAILFILCFLVIWIILRIIVAITRLGKNSEKGGMNTVLGGLLGAVKGLVVVIIITSVVSIIFPVFSLSDSDGFFSVSKSALNNSVFLRLMNDILN